MFAGKAVGVSYDAFISYSRHGDAELAIRLRDGMQALARPWRKRRALNVFLDQASLSASAGLRSSLRDQIDASRFLVVLASPAAAASRWVTEEIEYWLETKALGNISLVLTEGEIVWDDELGGLDGGRSTAIPEALAGSFAEEPAWVDLRWGRYEDDLDVRSNSRFRDDVATLAAPMHGVAKDDLIGSDIKQHRRSQRLRRAAVAGLAALAVLASIGGVLAVLNAREAETQRQAAVANEAEAVRQSGIADEQRNEAMRLQGVAEDEARRARAGLLAAQAQLQLEATPTAVEFGTTGFERAALLALASLQLQPTVEGDRALRAAMAVLPGRPQRWAPAFDEDLLAFSPTTVLSAAGSRLVLRSIGTNRIVAQHPMPEGLDPQFGLVAQFSIDGTILLIRNASTLTVWSVEPLDWLASWVADETITRALLSDDAVLAVLESGKMIRWNWDSDTTATLAVLDPAARALSISDDGSRAAILGDDGNVQVIDLDNGALLATVFVGHEIIDVRLSPNGDRLAAGQFDHVKLWDVATAALLQTLPHEWAVSNMSFSADDRYIATVTGPVSIDAADNDATMLVGSTVRVWDAETGAKLTEIPLAEEGGIHWTAFSADRNWLLTSTSGLDTLWLWNLWPGNLTIEACNRLSRNLSPTEAEEYLDVDDPPLICPDLPIPDVDGGVN